VYSTVITVSRFAFAYYSPDTIKSLNIMSYSIVGVMLFSLVCYFLGLNLILVFGSSASLGILFSSYVPYLCAIPSYFSQVYTTSNLFNTIIFYAIG
jgi:hypothetical protein